MDARSEPRPVALAIVAEMVGTGVLSATVTGASIVAAQSAQEPMLATLAIAAATAATLIAWIIALTPISGALLNPALSIAQACLRGVDPRTAAGLATSQTVGALFGAVVIRLLLDAPTARFTERDPLTIRAAAIEAIATAGLVAVATTVASAGQRVHTAIAVGGYVFAAFFVLPGSTANPAITIAGMVESSPTRLMDVALLIGAQLVAVAIAVATCKVAHLPEKSHTR